MTNSTLQSPQGGARVRFPPPLVFLGFLLVGAFIHSAVLPLPFPLPRSMTLAAGGLLVVAAIALFAASLRLFRATGQHPRPWLPTPSLIVEGPYRFSRNPLYVAMTLVQLGLGLLLDDVWIVAPSAANGRGFRDSGERSPGTCDRARRIGRGGTPPRAARR